MTAVASKAIVLVVPDDMAEEVSRLIASALSLNGYRHNNPSVIDWPIESPPRVRAVRIPEGGEGSDG